MSQDWLTVFIQVTTPAPQLRGLMLVILHTSTTKLKNNFSLHWDKCKNVDVLTHKNLPPLLTSALYSRHSILLPCTTDTQYSYLVLLILSTVTLYS